MRASSRSRTLPSFQASSAGSLAMPDTIGVTDPDRRGGRDGRRGGGGLAGRGRLRHQLRGPPAALGAPPAPPRMKGRVVAVRIEGDRLVQVFGEGRSRPRVAVPAQGQELHVFSGRCAQLRPADYGRLGPPDRGCRSQRSFDFYLAQFSKQLTAGYSKTMPDKGLVSFMPDAGETGKELP